MKVKNAAGKAVEVSATILVATDNSSDASLVKKLLAPEFDRVFVSTNPDLVVEDFERRAPDVLVLAFNSLEKSERYYLGLYRLSGKIHLQPHHTVILCNKNEINRAYEACRKEYFDDYILFWPMTHDAPRLRMSVHHALRNLNAIRNGLPSASQFAAQARNLAQMGNLIDRQMAQGGQRIDMVNRSMEQAEQEIGAVLDGFTSKLARGELLGVSRIENIVGLEREIKRLKQEEIGKRFRKAAESVQPITQWADEFRKECAPHIESARTLNAMADCIRPIVLVVDDDDFQRNILRALLEAEDYRLVFAGGGVEALNILRKMQPDLILMDILMPDLDGVETTRRLKTMPQFANVPVIMITGKSEGTSVRDSMKAGATDFLVKPFERDTLLAKVAYALRP